MESIFLLAEATGFREGRRRRCKLAIRARTAAGHRRVYTGIDEANLA